MEDRWRYLLRYLDPDRPPRAAEMPLLYEHPPYSVADEIVRGFEVDPMRSRKFLLVGARGGGKSTELREVERRLADKAVIASIDLDASGVTATSLSAFDLLYLSGLALLRLLPDAEQDALYQPLVHAYAGKSAAALGKHSKEALSGLMSFADATGKLAAAMGLETIAPGLAAGLGITNMGVRLLGRDRLVAETSPAGRGLQNACRTIAAAVRQVRHRPLCVLVDGLEKMNGQANERFQQVFCHTRLLADAEWTAAIAAPPSTFTATDTAASIGYVTLPVWGFAVDQVDELEGLLRRRFEIADLDPDTVVGADDLRHLAEQSGGMPRYAVLMLQNAVENALHDRAERLHAQHVERGIRRVAEGLARGLNSDDLKVLAYVHQRHELPGNRRAARLFSDGRILVRAPGADSPLPSFVVHPVLESVAARAEIAPGVSRGLEADDES